MAPPPRKRTDENEDLRDYPGLGRYKDGRYYIQHPTTGRQASLGTRDLGQAKRLWAAIRVRWESESTDAVAEKVAQKLAGLDTPKSRGADIHLSDYLRQWREEVLGYIKNPDGSVKLVQCHLTAKRGKARGVSAIAEPTRRDYGTDCLQLEASPAARFPMAAKNAPERIRQLLAPWITRPTHYNGLRNTLNRVFSHAIQTGVISRNPMRDIEKVVEPKRLVKIPDEAFAAITTRLMTHQLNKRTFDGEWRARICDMIYMFSQQPIDVFGLQESNIHNHLGDWGEIHFTRHKTKNPGVIEMNRELRELVEWFRDFKRREGIISPALMVYPRYMDKRSRGKPVQHRTIGTWWAEACIECGYTTTDHNGNTVALYQLRDLRKRGLTDEAKKAGGATNKGIHDTEAMRIHYVLDVPPKRAVNTLTGIKRQ